MSGWAFLGISLAICSGGFLNGLRFARKTSVPPRALLRGPGGGTPVERMQRIGRIQMIAAPIMAVLFIALCFGLLGPVQGIQTIVLQ